MRKISTYLSVFIISGLLFFISCDVMRKNKYPGFDYTENGLPYKFYVRSDTGRIADNGKLLGLKMTYGTKDSIFFNTEVTEDGLITLPMSESVYPGDIFEGLGLMHLGDSATFMVNADSFFLKTVQSPEVPPFAKGKGDLVFNVKLEKIQTQEEAMMEYQDQLAVLQMSEDSLLSKYLGDNNIIVQPTSTGLYFEEIRKGSGPLAKNGDLVTVDFSINLLDGTQIFSTKAAGEPVFFELGEPFDTEGMNEAIRMMKAGGSAKLIMPSSLAFGDKGRSNIIPPFTPLLCYVDLIKIESKAQFNQRRASEEQAEIDKYIREKGITQRPTASGLYYIENVKGTGAKPKAGDKVKVWYTGKLFDGTVFDSSAERNKAFEFVMGEGRVIKGWEEGIAMMNAGGKATLIIPSSLGYGDRGSGQKIPPFSPLVFEVELQEIIVK